MQLRIVEFEISQVAYFLLFFYAKIAIFLSLVLCHFLVQTLQFTKLFFFIHFGQENMKKLPYE